MGIFNLANMRLSALRAMDDLLRHLSLDGMEADDGSIIGVSLLGCKCSYAQAVTMYLPTCIFRRSRLYALGRKVKIRGVESFLFVIGLNSQLRSL